MQVLNVPEEKKGEAKEKRRRRRERGRENEEESKTVGRENFRGAFLACTRRRAHSNRNVVFLLSQVSHLEEKRGKSGEKMQEKCGGISEKVARKTMSFDVVVRVFGR